MIELAWSRPGRFFRGNLHCHSDRSDGVLEPAAVLRAYRAAGYDFVVLSDHFEAEYGWQVTDTSAYRDSSFTTLPGAELSSTTWTEPGACWVSAVGLPANFAAVPGEDKAETIRRAHRAGAFMVLLHPSLNTLSPGLAEQHRLLDSVHAVEVYNHSLATLWPDRAESQQFLDAALQAGRRLLANAGDDAHFTHPYDRFGGWVMVRAVDLDPEHLLAALHAGHYYSTQGPVLNEVTLDGDTLGVACSPVRAVVLSGGPAEGWLSAQRVIADRAEGVTRAQLSVRPFRGSFCRLTVLDTDGRRAWSNPLWID